MESESLVSLIVKVGSLLLRVTQEKKSYSGRFLVLTFLIVPKTIYSVYAYLYLMVLNVVALLV
ncbi:hypothetical protein Plim_3731 [Planctopirus limnophila DSM 3776]|uniref:Uncharacterized protein n=1 Tax=Planctopirus limnophila (strain ATCC 43296 / DSM 3776 / IFAM 1008 / Mu 290) TaxID=521674 RepID=D5SWF0_PLAL2|nr:hypothetical protein Plim_3731 [Planctopirus limnophila DSM 3776]